MCMWVITEEQNAGMEIIRKNHLRDLLFERERLSASRMDASTSSPVSSIARREPMQKYTKFHIENQWAKAGGGAESGEMTGESVQCERVIRGFASWAQRAAEWTRTRPRPHQSPGCHCLPPSTHSGAAARTTSAPSARTLFDYCSSPMSLKQKTRSVVWLHSACASSPATVCTFRTWDMLNIVIAILYI